MVITNSPLGNWDALRSLKITSKDGEFFIKCSLTLLATEFSILAEVGLPAIVVAWVGSPLVLIVGYLVSRKVLKMDVSIALLSPRLELAGKFPFASVYIQFQIVQDSCSRACYFPLRCGASAISAVGSVIEASNADITLSISVVAFFTVIFTFVQPYIGTYKADGAFL